VTRAPACRLCRGGSVGSGGRPQWSEDERPGCATSPRPKLTARGNRSGRNPRGVLPSRPGPGRRLGHLRRGSLPGRVYGDRRSQNVGRCKGKSAAAAACRGLAGTRYAYPGSGEGRVKLPCGRAGGCGLGRVRLGLPQPGHCIDQGHEVAGQRARLCGARRRARPTGAHRSRASRSGNSSRVTQPLLKPAARQHRHRPTGPGRLDKEPGFCSTGVATTPNSMPAGPSP
jgi:hypothetical protein